MKGGPYLNFSWQLGYGAFGISPSQIRDVVSYIDHQEEHHTTHSFQDEFRKLLKEFDINFDERYVWD